MKATNKLYAGVHGRSIIDHRIRCKLGLTVEEYIIIDFMTAIHSADLIASVECWKKIGITADELETKLKELNFKNPDAFQKWREEFAVDAYFEDFWNNIFKKHGNKADAKKCYSESVKLVDREYLHERARIYIATKTDFPNYTKAAEVWLNPKKKHWETLTPEEIAAEERKKKLQTIHPKSTFPGVKQ